MFNKFDFIAGGAAIGLMVFALYLTQMDNQLSRMEPVRQGAGLVTSQPEGVVVVNGDSDQAEQRASVASAFNTKGNITTMIVNDVIVGTGPAVAEGDSVVVEYVGKLQDGTEFDNSRKHGQSFSFTVGEGKVIPGWEEGVIGMQAGGERILVIPPEKAYGEAGIGPIPPNSTLIFSIELLEIN